MYLSHIEDFEFVLLKREIGRKFNDKNTKLMTVIIKEI